MLYIKWNVRIIQITIDDLFDEYNRIKDYTYQNNKQIFDKATNAFNKMQQDAQKDGINLYIISRYRSYSLQKMAL